MVVQISTSSSVFNYFCKVQVFNKYALFVAVNAEDDTTDNEFVDSDYSLEDDDRRAVDDTAIESVVGDAERGEGVGNQHPEDVIDARDVEDVPLDDER
ncbi:hypothetical protein ACFXTI_010187 [Malus domestica]